MSPPYASQPDEQLMQKYYQGDNAAVAELVRRHKDPLGGFLHFLVGPEDVAQRLLARWWPGVPCPPSVPTNRFAALKLLEEVWDELMWSRLFQRKRWDPSTNLVEGFLFALAGHEAYVRMIR
jgi:hypothetical protein